jgi:vesicle transport protein SEC22
MLSTLIARVSDGLPLAASVDDDVASDPNVDAHALNEGKAQMKAIVRKLTPQSEPRMSIESGKLTLHYLVAASPTGTGANEPIAYLTLADKSCPRKLVFSYLDELSKEFERSFGDDARKQGSRPYAFQKFDNFMQCVAFALPCLGHHRVAAQTNEAAVPGH